MNTNEENMRIIWDVLDELDPVDKLRGGRRRYDDLCCAMANIRETLGLVSEVDSENGFTDPIALTAAENITLLECAANQANEIETRGEREWSYYNNDEEAQLKAEAVTLRAICERNSYII